MDKMEIAKIIAAKVPSLVEAFNEINTVKSKTSTEFDAKVSKVTNELFADSGIGEVIAKTFGYDLSGVQGYIVGFLMGVACEHVAALKRGQEVTK